MTIRPDPLETPAPSSNRIDMAEKERPSLPVVLRELLENAKAFGQSEIAWFKGEMGERRALAVPAAIFAGVAIALFLGVLIALPTGLILILAPILGTGWSVLAVLGGGTLLAALLLLWAIAKFKRAFRPVEFPK